MKTVLFLCTGNYYRSRFAEILFNWHAERRQAPWRADSRGLQLDPRNPGPLSRHTISALRSLGVPFENAQRLPLPLTAADLQSAGHVVAVKEAEHRKLLERQFPAWLDHVEFWHVHDVDFAEPHEALPLLQTHVLQLIDRLCGPEQATDLRHSA